MREDTVAFYTAMEIPVAEALGRAFGGGNVSFSASAKKRRSVFTK